MHKIIIYLINSDLSQIAWAETNGENPGNSAVKLHGTLADLELLEKKDYQEIILIATAQDVLLTEAKLPKLNQQRLLQALPFALEEQLLSDVNDSHFAIGPHQADGIQVAIIAKKTLANWITAFKQIGLNPTAIYPAVLALPLANNLHWQISIFGETVLVRTGAYTGFACDKHNLAMLLDVNIAAKPVETNEQRQITLVNYSLEPFDLSFAATEVTHAKPEQFLLSLNNNYSQASINLLQGPYRPRRNAAHTHKIWQLAGILTASWLGLFLVGNVVSFLILHHETSQLETAINTIYKRNFPAATSIAAPKARMTERLDTLTNQNHKNRLLIWLAHIGQSLPAAHDIHIDLMDFRNNQLAFSVTTPNINHIDKLTEQLTQQGLTVKQENITATGNKVTGTLLISEGHES
jgi:general secretion pathway protein L